MAWQTEMGIILRVMLDDLGDSPVYTDNRITLLLATGARQVNAELDMGYSVNVGAMTISPDPTTASPPDEAFINLTCLKVMCLIERNAARRAADKGVLLRDGGTMVDARDKAKHALALLAQNFCQAYSDAKVEYSVQRSACAAIMGPIRIYASEVYNSRHDYRSE